MGLPSPWLRSPCATPGHSLHDQSHGLRSFTGRIRCSQLTEDDGLPAGEVELLIRIRAEAPPSQAASATLPAACTPGAQPDAPLPITRVQPTIELSHGSTTRDGTAAGDDSTLPRSQHPDQPERGPQPRPPDRERYPRPLPQRMRPGPLVKRCLSRHPRRADEPGPHPSCGGARRTRSPGRTEDGTGASHAHVGTDHLDQVLLTMGPTRSASASSAPCAASSSTRP
jgi:hypothetical protein